jgi:hypothetical protein
MWALQLALIGNDRRPSDFPLFMEDLPCLGRHRSSWFERKPRDPTPRRQSQRSRGLERQYGWEVNGAYGCSGRRGKFDR